jgi:hypothetical protein
MRNTTYYYEQFSPHKVVYTINSFGYAGFKMSDRIWCQGPYGGIRVVTENFMNQKYTSGEKIYYGKRYVTKNEKAMREFAWAKLRAEPYLKEKV